MITLANALTTVQETLTSVACVANGTVTYLNSLSVAVDAAQTLAQTTAAEADRFLLSAGNAANFASGTPVLTLIDNVNALVALTNAVPYLEDVANQLGSMGKFVDSVEAFGNVTTAPLQLPASVGG